jgi:hypothetical protein
MSQTGVVPERPCEIIGVQGQVVVYHLEAGLEGQDCCRLCQTTSSKTRKLSDRWRRFSHGLSPFVPLYNQDILGALWIVSTVVSAAGSVHIHVEAPVSRLCRYCCSTSQEARCSQA